MRPETRILQAERYLRDISMILPVDSTEMSIASLLELLEHLRRHPEELEQFLIKD